MNIDVGAVRRAKEGSTESFELVYAQIAPDLYKLALYTLGNSYDAEDVVSETFMEAYKGIHKLRDEGSFRPWIMKILSVRCKRKIGQYIKDKNNTDIDEMLDLTDDTAPHGQSTEITAALDSLAHDEKMIVVLSVLQGYTSKEIGQILSLPQGTVSSKLHRSLKKLKTMLS